MLWKHGFIRSWADTLVISLCMCAFLLIFMSTYLHMYRKYHNIWFSYTEFILHVLQGHSVASSLHVSACLPSSPVLEKPSQTAVAKGGCVCENTHLSPADGSFPGHTVPPARLPSRAWPSPQPAQQATGITSPCWQDPSYGLKVRNTSSNAGQYPAFPSHLSPFCPQKRHQFVIYLLRQGKDTPPWLFLFFCWVSNMCRQLSKGELVNWDRTICRWCCGNGELAWHFVFMSHCTHTHTHKLTLFVFPAFCKAVCFREMSIPVAIKDTKSALSLDFLDNSSRSSRQIAVWGFYMQDIHHSDLLTETQLIPHTYTYTY